MSVYFLLARSPSARRARRNRSPRRLKRLSPALLYKHFHVLGLDFRLETVNNPIAFEPFDGISGIMKEKGSMKNFPHTYLIFACAVLAIVPAWAQAPVGTIAGVVTDESGAVIPNAVLTVVNKGSGAVRDLKSDAAGTFTAAALPAGEYEVKAVVAGFRTTLREATVETGATTTVDMRMQVGQSKDVVTVEAATAQIEYERHSIDGVITRQKIQELPLNGRSFLNLAFLEPGVTVSPGSTSQYNALFSVSVLGGDSSKTAITVDGGNIRNSIEGGSGMNFSQEVVQEFQLSSAQFDLSTGITSVGAVNVVTRSGSNDFHGSAYFFFRDHNMSAYPGLQRNALNPDPFFARRNPGFWIGGPIKKDKLHFFFNYENINQAQVFTFVSNLPSASGLTGNFGSPYQGKTLSAKFDYQLNSKHHLLARYSHDGNKGFGPNSNLSLPSNWVQNKNWSDQSLLGVTSSLRANLINDFRFSYQYWQNRNLFPDSSSCSGCLGLLSPQINIYQTNVTIGDTSNATQGRDLRRYNFTDSLNWQKGSHGFKFGFEYDHAPGTGFWGFCDPACITVGSPELVRSNLSGPASALLGVYYPTLPTTVRTAQDFQNLPLLNVIVGIGDPSQPPPYNVDKAKANNRNRFFAQDTWKVRPRLTLNYGLAWNFESTLVNRDLDKPKYLAPLYGNDLSPTSNNYHNFSPALGFAWQADKSAKTVVRGGFGMYYDTESLYKRLQERAYTGPIGNGRIQYPASGFTNIFPNIINLSRGLIPVPVGSPIPQGELTNMTVAQFQEILRQQGPGITAALAPKNLNDLSVRNIEVSKSGTQLYPKDFPVQRSLQFSLGVQRQLAHQMVLSVDYVRRVFLNTSLGEVDLNRWNRTINGVRSPVIPACVGTQSSNPAAQCSTGPITFWIPGGREVYNAMLVKLDKRFSHRYQFTASYALTDQHGYNGIADLDHYNASWGPKGARHILNLSGTIDIPLGFQLSIISQTSSRGPLTANVAGVDLTGDGTTNQYLPGLAYNCLNRGCGKPELSAAVDDWNTNYAGKKDALGKVIPKVILPGRYELGDNFNSQDVRLTKLFKFGTEPHQYRFSVFAEGFNIFNQANLSGYSFNLDQVQANQVYSFGQPTGRQSQVFGSGGPRAFQIGGRFQF